MAENKKTKVSFAEGLKAQAEKLVPKKTEDENEVVMVDLGDGALVPIPRGSGPDRLDDDVWEQVKKRQAQMPEKRSGDKLIVKRGTSTMTVLRDNQTDDEWKKVVENNKQDHGKLNVEEHSAAPVQEWGEGTIYPTKEVYERLKSMPDGEAKKQELGKLQKASQKVSDSAAESAEEASLGSGGPGMSPRANMQAMATAAVPTGSTPGLGDEGVAQANAKGEQHGREDLAAVKGAVSKANDVAGSINQYNPLSAQSWTQPIANMRDKADAVIGGAPLVSDETAKLPGRAMQAVGTGVGATMEGAGDVLGMPNLAAKGADIKQTGMLGDLANMPAPGTLPVPVDPNTPHSDQVQPLPQVVTPGPGGGSASLSMSTRGGGGFTPAQSDPQLAKNTAESATLMKQAQADFADTQAAAEIMSDNLVRKGSERRMEVEKLNAMEAKLATESRLAGIQEAERVRGLQSAVQAEAEAASRVPTDPNRYWNNKDDGQKAAAVIAGALFGFTGQGMQWLQRIDGLIESDMRVQMADRSAKVQGLESKARGLGEAANFAMAKGASEAEAMVLSRQMRLDGLKTYLEDLTSKQTNLDRKMAGQQMLMQLGEKRMQLDMQLAAFGEQKTHNQNQVRYQNAQLGLQSEALRISEAKNGAGGGGRPLPEAGAKLMDEYSSAVQNLQAMKDKVKNTGAGNRLFQRFAQSGWTPGNEAEKNLHNDYKALKFQWMTIKARGALQGIEIQNLESLLPERGQLMSDPSKQLDSAITTARDELNRAIRQQQQAGFDMSRYAADPLASGQEPKLRTERPAQ